MLQPSLSSGIALDPGIIRLNINYINKGEERKEQRHHRMFMDAPAADAKPPSGVPVIALESVRLCMEVLEARQRTKTMHKRLRLADRDDELRQLEIGLVETNVGSGFDILLHEIGRPVQEELLVPDTRHHSVLPQIEAKPKGKARRINKRTKSSPALRSVHHDGKHRRPVTITDLQDSPHSAAAAAVTARNQVEIHHIVDGALRLSVSGSFSNKSANGIKVKANTFRAGLADIAPALWRPSYLTVGKLYPVLLNVLTL